MSGESTYSSTLTKYLQIGFGTVFSFIVAMVTFMINYELKHGWTVPSIEALEFYLAGGFAVFCMFIEFFFSKALLKSLTEKRIQDKENKSKADKREQLDLEKSELVNSILKKIDQAIDKKDIEAIINSLIKASKDDPQNLAKILKELLLIKELFK